MTCAGLVASLCLVGCKGSDEETSATNQNGTPAKPFQANTKGNVYSTPPANVEGGYAVSPANPDDPRFKPDPKLAGAGGTGGNVGAEAH